MEQSSENQLKDNEIKGNHWDLFRGLDLDHDEISDIPYAINEFECSDSNGDC